MTVKTALVIATNDVRCHAAKDHVTQKWAGFIVLLRDDGSQKVYISTEPIFDSETVALAEMATFIGVARWWIRDQGGAKAVMNRMLPGLGDYWFAGGTHH
jgi:hypothetical protein